MRRQVTTAGDIHPRKERHTKIKRVAMLLFQTKLRGASTIVALSLILAGLADLSHLKTDITQYMEHPYQHQHKEQ